MTAKLMRVFLLLLAGLSTFPQAAPAQGLSEGRAIFSPISEATLSAELAALVREMPFRPGRRFARGDLLVRLDCRLFDAQAFRAEAQYDIALLRAENALELERRNSIGRVDARVAAIERDKGQAEARVARLNAERCEIHAPFAGRVASWEVHPHERAEPGMPLIRIIGTDRFEVEIVAGTDWIGRVEIGDIVEIALDQRPQTVTATVRALAPEMDPVSQTVTVYASVEDADELLGGMTGTATASRAQTIAGN